MIKLRFYHRQGCHLCDEMLQALSELKSERDFEIIEVDIDRYPEKSQGYALRIPLLENPEGECLSEHFIDRERLLSYLQSA
ncbi:MAG: glutaredoxin family protein [Candidatus Thiodiazotropha sp.]